ncbi:penicillin-binding protein 2 [Treponema sp.]|uniref:penicillin-binding protein 2 n=1 Tax=Treponema sp. TaxID=166 RepID=UPI0025DB4816|nr:penicillin-binding protein 2 [Treponema sp.]MCR5217519.1 penicillin-binding protein 2 [Treponema sp.]
MIYGRYSGGNSPNRDFKIAVLTLIIIFSLSLYAVRLFTIQVISGKQYREDTDKISTDYDELPAQRGEIFDRNNNVALVINTDSFAVELTTGNIPKGYYDTVTTKLAQYLGISKSSIDEKIKGRYNSYAPVQVKRNVPLNIISNIAENITDFPGVTWKNKPNRNYLESGSISHVLGYVGTITDEELNLNYNKGYKDGDVIGKTGIEKQYDLILKGKPGRVKRIVDAQRRVLNSLTDIEAPESGKKLVLTIDTTIQQLAEQALGERVGSIVVLKPATGEILAMVSYPYYDNNLFSSDDSNLLYKKTTQMPNNPFLNRAVNAEYPPASTFKIIMTTALLNENAYPEEKTILCPGSINYGNRIFRCHVYRSGGRHGPLNLKNALAQSCDVYYWIAGRDYLGVDTIGEYAHEFGLGDSLQLDLPADTQKTGLVPSPAYHERKTHKEWLGGDTMNMSIGQGDNLVTPLHIADMMAMVCNSGVIYKPHLLKEIRDPVTDDIIQTIQPEVLKKADNISPEVWKKVQADLRYVITDGTPQYPLANKSVQIAGKTGTGEDSSLLADHWHSWMVTYAPYNAKPEDQVVVSVLVDGVNKWEWWAPYASNIVLQGIFNDQTYEEAVESLPNVKYELTYGRSSSRGRQE